MPEDVAPLAGAWIEIYMKQAEEKRKASLPSRERGLKLAKVAKNKFAPEVAPLAGAWIEIDCTVL